MVLIDSSAWIAATRERGDDALRERVNGLVRERSAAWCAAIRLELWPGARGGRELDRLIELREFVVDLEITPEVWEHAIALARRSRDSGLTCPYPDMLIYACSAVHGVELLHRDRHFDLLAKL